MTTKNFRPAEKTALCAAALLVTLTGCMTAGNYPHSGYRQNSEVQVQTVAVLQDDYDYYPGYETYYNRNRHEYVYRDGNAWVRRPAPHGVSADFLMTAPSVRLDFHDSPEQHHNAVIKSYPKTWKQPAKAHDDKASPRDERKDDRRDDEKRN